MAVPVNESLPVPTAQVLTGRRASVLVQMLAIVSLLLLATTCRYSSASVVYVSPECPRSGSAAANTDEQQSPCEELSSALDGLESNTTLVLLPGKHYLNRSLTVSDKTGLIIRGNGSSHSFSYIDECCGAPPQVVASAEVTCTSDVNSGLAFYNVDGLTIENISFSQCGAENNVEDLSLKFKAAALFLYNVRNAVLSGVTVQKSYGYGLIGFNVYGESLITASTFFRNNYYIRYISCGGNVLFYFTRRSSNDNFNNALRIDSSTFASSWSDCSVSGAGVNIILDQSSYEVNVTITNVTSCSNEAIDGANFYLEVGSTVAKSSITMEKVRSIYGYADYFGGGLLYRYKGFGFIDAPTANIEVPLTIVDSEFSENTALHFGAGIYLDVLQEKYQRITLENCSIHDNTGGDGIGVHAYFGGFSAARLQMKNVSLDSNEAFSNTDSVVSLNYVGSASFQDCSFTHNEAIGLYMLNSNATMSGEITFFSNTAKKGGGAFLEENSLLFLLNPSHINFTQNTATTKGGALFVNKPSSGCFLQIVDPDSPDTFVSFHNNTAGEAGSVLYGGNLYPMPGVKPCNQFSLNETFDTSKFFKFTALQNVTSNISSDPFAVYSCRSSETLESEFIVKKAFPGQTIEVPVVTVGQENGSVPASVKATINGHVIKKMSGKTCANLGYTDLVSENITSPVTVNLTLGLSDYVNSVSLNVMVTIYPCPIGFQMEAFSCKCDAQFRTTTVTCSIEYENITHSESFWFGPVNNGTEMALYDPCPFDYCVSGERSIPVDELDQQCSNNRSGTLCGQCRENYSLVLGSSRCMECSYNNISLILAFAVLGVVLVLLLALCNLTVAKGTINGLIFYANIVQFNHTVFFPSPVEGYTYFLSVFIAWINLDFGIETCFFDGMTSLWSVGLQLIFPLYLILLMGMVQLLARVSSPLSKVVGYFNGTAVFATLFLLSYAKTVRTVITTIAVVRLHNSWVWLYDGGVSVTNWEWIVLAMIMMAVFFFLLIPYTLMLVFIQVLQRMSHLRFLRLLMMKYLKPWCDVYLNHYKKEFYFWTGLLLIMRFVLFIVSSFSPKPVDGLLATVIVSALLLAIAWFRGGVYNKWWLNALECFFLLNLCLLSATSLYVRVTTGDSGSDSHNGMKNATVGTSVTLAFVCFLIIFSWHCFQLAKKSKKVQNTVARVQHIFTKKADDIKKEEEVEVKGYEHEERSASITTMIVELREPMLDDC